MSFFTMFTARQQWVQPDGTPTPSFYRWMANLFQSAGGGGPVQSVTSSSSPLIYTAAIAGQLIVHGGTVSAISISRDGGQNFYAIGQTQGMFLLKPQDQLKVTYSAAPTLTFIPA